MSKIGILGAVALISFSALANEWNPAEAEPTTEFCSVWNPDFAFRGNRCCGKGAVRTRKPAGGRFCSSHRAKNSFCDEMTPDQRGYTVQMQATPSEEVFQKIEQELGQNGPQSYCTPNDGFLAWGRPIIENELNRLKIRRPDRCVHFGTDRMVILLEWIGRKVGERYPLPQYQDTHLLVGDMSAPRGGCLTGDGGRNGHSSHTTGRDVDLGFLDSHPRRPSSAQFSRDFDAEDNWWMVKEVFANPYVCIEKIFLDHRLIQKMRKVAADDPMWEKVSPFVRHLAHHRNHMHIRVGFAPGKPGCPLEETSGDSSLARQRAPEKNPGSPSS